MRTLVLVGRLIPKLGGCRRLPLLPMLTQNGRLINVASRLKRPHWLQLISTQAQANGCQFGCDGKPLLDRCPYLREARLTQLGIPTTNHQTPFSASLSGCAASFRPTPSPTPRLQRLRQPHMSSQPSLIRPAADPSEMACIAVSKLQQKYAAFYKSQTDAMASTRLSNAVRRLYLPECA
jgi:hypothetical protein